MDPTEETMKRTLMASVAALALCAATNLAFAQGAPAPKAEPAAPPAAAPSAPQSAPGGPAPKAGPTAQEKAAPSAAPAQAQEKSEPKAAPQRAQDKADTKAPDTKAPATKAGDAKSDTKPAAADTKSGDKKPAAADSKSGDTKPAAADSNSGTKPASADTKSGTAASAPAAAPPAEKRTQITTVIKQEKVTEVTNVNFNISIGTRVPSTVTYHPLPSRVIEIYPEWRGYYFILVKGRYVILRPETYEIVYIIEG